MKVFPYKSDKNFTKNVFSKIFKTVEQYMPANIDIYMYSHNVFKFIQRYLNFGDNLECVHICASGPGPPLGFIGPGLKDSS